MATLTGQKIKDSYKDLLQVSNSNSGIDGTLRTISDGEATDSVLQLSSSAVNISSAGALQYAGTAITSTAAELNILDGVTASTAELNILDGVTSTTAELNILDGATVTVTELNYLDGADSSITTLSLPDNTTITTFGASLVDDADAATARTTLGVDAAGTDNSTNVTLVTTSHDYLSISGQAITLGTIDISDDTNLVGGTGITLTGDTLSTTDSEIVHDSLSGFVANEHINHSSVSITAGTGLSGGGDLTTTRTLSTNDSEIVHDNLSGFVGNEHIDHSGVTITAGSGLTGGGDITTTRTLNVGAGTHITVNADDVAVNTTTLFSAPDFTGTATGVNLTLSGDLTVNGTTTTINSTTVTVDDPIFTLGGDTAPASDDNKDRGIEFRWHNGSAAKVGFFGYDDSAEVFTFIQDATNTSEVFSGSAGNVAFGNIAGTLTTASQTNITGVGALNAGSITSGFGAIDNGSSNITTTGTISFGSLTDGSITIADIKDEDDLVSDSATSLVTQQSIKAYIDAQIISASEGDITAVTAGDGLTGGATSGAATLNIGAGTGIDVAADAISVDVSDFMTNGSDNRVLTATGTDAMNAEANLTFDASSNLDLLSDSGKLRIGADSELEIYHNGTNDFIDSGGTAMFFRQGTTEKIKFNSAGNIQFNNAQADINTRFGTTGSTNTLFIDGGTDRVGIGTNSPGEKLEVSGNIKTTAHLVLPYGEINDAGTDLNIVGTNAVTLQTSAGTALTFANASLAAVFADDVKLAATKKLYLDGGGDTYIFEESADNVIHYVGGQNKLRFNSTGTILNDAGLALDFRVEGDSDQNLFFTDGSADRVGIGTNSPNVKLHINDNDVLIGNNNNGYATLNFHSETTGSARYASIMKNYDSPFDMRIRASNSTSETPLVFDGSNDTEYARFDISGNFGIGTNSPSHKLDVNGGIRNYANGSAVLRTESTAAGYGAYNKLITTTNTYDVYALNGDFKIDENGVATRLTIKDSTGHIELPNDNQYLKFGAGGDGVIYSLNDDFYISNFTAGQDTIFQNLNSAGTSYVTNLFIDGSEERVGIGTTSPSFKLKVNVDNGTYTDIETIAAFQSKRSADSETEAGLFINAIGDALGGQISSNYYYTDNVAARGNTGRSGAIFGMSNNAGAAGTHSSFYWQTSPNNSNTLTDRMILDTSGNLLIGASSNRTTVSGYSPRLNTEGAGAAGYVQIVDNENSQFHGGTLALHKYRSGGIAANTELGSLYFGGTDSANSTYAQGALIKAYAQGTDSTSNVATDLAFFTNTGSAMTRAMTIDDSQNVGIGETSIDAKLHLTTASSGLVNQKFESAGSSAWRIGVPAGQTYFAFDDSSDDLSSPEVVFTTAGDVGIGTSSPNSSLHINTTSDGSVYFTRGGLYPWSIEHDTSQLYFYNRTINKSIIKLTHAGTMVINNDKNAAVDFRVAGTVDTYGLLYDASANALGIGTSSPTSKLHVNTGTDISMDASGNGQVRVEGNGYALGIALNGSGAFIYHNSSARFLSFGTNETEQVRLTTGGALHVDNDVVAFSTTPSDKKLKTNVKDIEYGLDTIMKLKPKQYDWKEDNRHDIGFIAQEVEEVIPEIVKDNEWFDDKIKTLDYEKLTAVLIKAVQEQQQQINELKEKLNG